MSSNDPMDQFFTDQEQDASPYLLYTALGIPITDKADREKVTQEVVRRAYRKAAVRCHPDKHSDKTEREKQKWVDEFQKVGFAYAVLSDEKRRARYDSTGGTSEALFDDIGEGMEWAAYFESVFTKVDKKMLDEDRIRYQNSKEEADDVLEAYRKASGDLDDIMSRIPHSTTKDESRFIALIESEIESGSIERLRKWTETSVNVKGKRRRVKVERGEAKEAEEHAKHLGIWDEMYGDGKAQTTNSGVKKGEGSKARGKRGKRSRDDGDEDADEAENKPEVSGDRDGDDMSGLAAMIARRQGARESAMNALFDKYSQPSGVKRSKKK